MWHLFRLKTPDKLQNPWLRLGVLLYQGYVVLELHSQTNGRFLANWTHPFNHPWSVIPTSGLGSRHLQEVITATAQSAHQ